MLDEIVALSYPKWLADVAPYLPDLDFTCVARSGQSYLEASVSNATAATIAGLLSAITTGCRNDDLVLSGGYNQGTQELEINMLIDTNGIRNL